MAATEGSRTTEKALSLLDYFSTERTELTLTQFQELAGFPASTLFRLLTSLHHTGFLEYSKKTKQYSPGVKLIKLGFLASESFDVYRIAKPYMQKLKTETKETITLFIRRELSKVCIGTVESDYPIRYSAKQGEEIPLFIGASGKVLLSRLANSEIAEIANKIGFKKITPNSDSSLEQIIKKVDFVRENGYAMSWGERQISSAGFGVPITDFKGDVIASINISLPAERLQDYVLPQWIETLKNTGAEISRKLGS